VRALVAAPAAGVRVERSALMDVRGPVVLVLVDLTRIRALHRVSPVGPHAEGEAAQTVPWRTHPRRYAGAPAFLAGAKVLRGVARRRVARDGANDHCSLHNCPGSSPVLFRNSGSPR